MNQQTDPQAKLASVDLDQWRQEIDVFAAATASALDSIVSELSTACSGNPVRSIYQTGHTKTADNRSPISRTSKNETAVKRASGPQTSVTRTNSATNGGSRLASIKEKLASRINKD